MGKLKEFFYKVSYLFQWESVFFSQEMDQYCRAKGVLNDNGIKSKSKISSNNHGFTQSGGSYVKNNYEILVKPKDVGLASMLINSHR